MLSEITFYLNGPYPVNCDSLVDEANKLYQSKCKVKNSEFGHFIRTSLNIKSLTDSKSVDEVKSIQSNLNYLS